MVLQFTYVFVSKFLLLTLLHVCFMQWHAFGKAYQEHELYPIPVHSVGMCIHTCKLNAPMFTVKCYNCLFIASHFRLQKQ